MLSDRNIEEIEKACVELGEGRVAFSPAGVMMLVAEIRALKLELKEMRKLLALKEWDGRETYN